ncbi:MAG: CoA ester lyase [Herpetosiphon sp.]
MQQLPRQRSILSVPGSNPRFINKAATSAADAIIFDLEDSVAPDQRPQARTNVVAGLLQHRWEGHLVCVRVNPTSSPFFYRDLITVVEGAGTVLDRIVVPKVHRPEDVYLVATLLDQIEQLHQIAPAAGSDHRIGLELQIESAQGMTNVDAIARASARNRTLIFGPGDFAASIGMPVLGIGALGDRDAQTIAQIYLSRMLVAARSAGLLAIDGPFAAFHDEPGLRTSTTLSRRLGYDGKWVIHPDQIAVVNDLFTPSPDEITAARSIVAAHAAAISSGRAAHQVRGEMLDQASVALAVRLLERAGVDPC